MARLTGANIGRRLALVAGEERLLAAPIVRSTIRDRAQITFGASHRGRGARPGRGARRPRRPAWCFPEVSADAVTLRVTWGPDRGRKKLRLRPGPGRFPGPPRQGARYFSARPRDGGCKRFLRRRDDRQRSDRRAYHLADKVRLDALSHRASGDGVAAGTAAAGRVAPPRRSRWTSIASWRPRSGPSWRPTAPAATARTSPRASSTSAGYTRQQAGRARPPAVGQRARDAGATGRCRRRRRPSTPPTSCGAQVDRLDRSAARARGRAERRRSRAGAAAPAEQRRVRLHDPRSARASTSGPPASSRSIRPTRPASTTRASR